MPELDWEREQQLLADVEALKQGHYNVTWRYPEYKVWLEEEDRPATYPECYDREITRSQQIFQEVNTVTEREIPAGKYLLFVDMVESGTTGHPDIKYIDQDRLAKMYEAETGSPDLGQDFQPANMRHCFGFNPEDNRFRTSKALREDLPTDLSGCVGIILSGSEANIKDEQNQRRLAMIEKVSVLIRRAKDLGIPMFGICFGSQLLNTVFRAQVDWIRDKENQQPAEETGLVKLRKTAAGQEGDSPVAELPDEFYVHANHKQEVLKDSMPEELEILATSEKSDVQIVRLKSANLLWAIQNHIECGDTRAHVSQDLNQIETLQPHMFQGESSKARRVICPNFLRACGQFAREQLIKGK